MKWLSIKNRIPPTGSLLLLRIKTNNGERHIYEKYLIASLEFYPKSEEMNNIKNWELYNNAIQEDYDRFHITHFAIMDSVEKE